ncbi:hypothetical protein AB6D11_00455 [Vibrio splendidus]
MTRQDNRTFQQRVKVRIQCAIMLLAAFGASMMAYFAVYVFPILVYAQYYDLSLGVALMQIVHTYAGSPYFIGMIFVYWLTYRVIKRVRVRWRAHRYLLERNPDKKTKKSD